MEWVQHTTGLRHCIEAVYTAEGLFDRSKTNHSIRNAYEKWTVSLQEPQPEQPSAHAPDPRQGAEPREIHADASSPCSAPEGLNNCLGAFMLLCAGLQMFQVLSLEDKPITLIRLAEIDKNAVSEQRAGAVWPWAHQYVESICGPAKPYVNFSAPF